jgi:WhiB family transcriptional regulator, redox-sensing transcriptional regulator
MSTAQNCNASGEVRSAMTATALSNISLGACTQDPDRWTTAPDIEAKALCRACPRRWLCAREAVESPGAEGLWAGVVIPEAGRARAFALRQLRSLAERYGYPVRVTAKSA